MILKNGFCAICGHKQSIDFDDEPFTDELNLKNYLKFRAIRLNQCEKCGYVAENLFDKTDDKIKDIVQTEEYKKILNYEFISPYKDLPDMEYRDMDINRLEAYSIINNMLGNDLICARAMGNIADLKYSLASTYLETKYMKEDDELNDSYDKVFEMLSTQSQKDNEKSINYLKKLKITQAIVKIFVAERLSFAYRYDEARQIIEKLTENHTFSVDLLKYIDNFLTEVEQL